MIHLEAPENFNPQFETVSCFVECNGKFLLLHRNKNKSEGGKWGPPGGKKERNEDVNQAVVREITEETGLISTSGLEPRFFQTVFVRYQEYDFLFHMFHLLAPNQSFVTLNEDEHQSFVWVTLSEALQMNLVKDEDTCIKLFYNI